MNVEKIQESEKPLRENQISFLGDTLNRGFTIELQNFQEGEGENKEMIIETKRENIKTDDNQISLQNVNQSLGSNITTKLMKTIIGFSYKDYFVKIKIGIENSDQKVDELKLHLEQSEGNL